MTHRSSLQSVLAEYMAERGFSQADLARATGLPKPTISRWLSGRTVNPYDHDGLLRVAAALKLHKVETNRLLHAVNGPTVDALLAAPRDEQQRELLEPWRGVAATRTNLPAELTSFVGREDEVVAIAEMLCRGTTRLLTLTGAGGSGKTRLALRVASDLLDVFPDGIFLVSLAPLIDATSVPAAIMRALDLREVPGIALADRLADWLRTRRALLLLDNLEHLIEAGLTIVEILRAAPGSAALVTSRVPLRVSGEFEWSVSPLPLPADQRLATLRQNPAVALFLQRAQAVRPHLDLSTDREQLRAVAEVCTRLDGLPLAIELAAARIRDAEPDRLLARFPSRLDLGSDGPRDVERRQQTLRDTIDWSLRLLPPAARIVFRRLAVFEGSFGRPAAIAVCTSEGLLPASVKYVLSDLLEAHMIELIGTAIGGPRYRMLETIREFAQEQLEESDEESLMRERHARYFLILAESAPPYFPETRTGDWFVRVDQDLDNLRAALTWLQSRSDHERLVRLAAGLWPYWFEYWHINEGRSWLNRILPPADGLPANPRLALLAGACVLEFSQGDYDAVMRHSDDALTLASQLGDQHRTALVRQYKAWGVYSAGDVAQAIPLFKEALQSWRQVGDPRGVARALSDVAFVLFTSGDFAAALPYLGEAARLYAEVNEPMGLARSAADRGLFALLRGEIAEAITLLSDAVERLRALDRNYLLPTTIFYFGTALCFAERLDTALACYRESLELHQEQGNKLGVSLALLGFAAVAHRQGNSGRAAMLCGASHALRESTGIGLAPAIQALYQREVALVIEQIGPAAFATAFAEGSDLHLRGSIEFARETLQVDWSQR